MSDDNSESEDEEEVMTKEDKEFLDDQTVEEDLSMYRRLETENIRSEMKTCQF